MADTMLSSELPVLYRSADSLSRSAQRRFFRFLGGNLVLLVTSALTTELVADDSIAAILLLIQLLASVGCATALAFWKHQETWYKARALAESVKTMTWRFALKAEPYDEDSRATTLFLENLKRLLEDNASLPFDALRGDQITSRMLDCRKMNWVDRKSLYQSGRVDDQREWYFNKSKANRRNAQYWYGGVIVLHIVAVVTLVLAISNPSFKLWAVNIMLAAAGSAMAWLQTKRYNDLAASYALTLHDIDLLKSALGRVTSEEELSTFIGDAENAFSREHTQWRARRDAA
jgi:uncharacterized membrane protein YhaH (DUF805 family)